MVVKGKKSQAIGDGDAVVIEVSEAFDAVLQRHLPPNSEGMKIR
jgi:hypothetical protein